MGRNAAELTAAATATGLFAGPRRVYVGDGYSVPYQICVGPVPIGFPTLYAYKLYLDFICPEGAHLHDWLYTPYGELIGVTQVEADDAIQEILGRVSLRDALIVGNACRYFGSAYFGNSQVGYFGENGVILADNIGIAGQPASTEPTTMATKIVILFQQTTVPGAGSAPVNYAPVARTGGWSESMYGPDSVAAVIAGLNGPRSGGVKPILQARANVLSRNANIIGVRLYQGGAGKGQLVAAAWAGNNGPSDQPNICLQCSATSLTSGQSRRWTLRGFPDADVVQGEWNPTASDTPARLVDYFNSLAGFGWMQRTYTSKVNINTIDADGVVWADAVIGYGIGQKVTLNNVTVDATGNRIGGTFRVIAGGGLNTQFKVTPWTYGTARGGIAYIAGKEFQDFAGSLKSVVRASVRKIGRPFAGYRGRKSKRRVRV